MGLGLTAALAACGSGADPAQEVDLSGPPRTGGSISIGFVGGGASDTLDGSIAENMGDIARAINLYSTLLYFDDDYELQPMLATKVTPNDDASVWTVELREGVEFSDGSPITVDDVIASFERIVDPDDPKTGAAALGIIEHMVPTGDHTIEFHLKSSNTALDEEFAQYTSIIVPKDFDPDKPIGSGPFVLDSFTPAQSTVLKRNPRYWGDEGPYLDEVSLLNFNDTDALINALLSSQVDAVAQVPPALTEVMAADERIDILDSETGMYMPFTMRVDKKPFDDVRVRQAFRLAVDRKGMIEQVLSGKGTIGNDMFAIFDPAYPKDLPQREQDIAQAKKLLADAGHPDGIEVELVTAPIQSGVVEAAQVFAEQAQEAGITVKINKMDLTEYWTDYLNYDFSQTFWYTRNFLAQANSAVSPGSPFNETHWDDEDFNDVVAEARAEVDEKKRDALIGKAQKILYDSGGYITWGFSDQVDAYQRYLGGFVKNRTGIPLSGFRLDRVWIGGTK